MFFLNTNVESSYPDLPVVLYHVKKMKLTTVTQSFKDLNIQLAHGSRDESESLKAEGNALYGEGNPDGAIEKYHQALAIDSSNPLPYNNLGMVISSIDGDINQAEFFYQMSLLQDPNDQNTMRGISGVLVHQGENEAAIEIVKKALSIERSPYNLMVMSRIALVCKELDLALESCNAGLEIIPDDTEFLEMKETIEDR